MTNTTDLAIADAPDLPDLTHKQLGFVQGILEGMTASDAYRASYDAENMSNECLWVKASELRSSGNVSVWLKAARDYALVSSVMTKEAYLQELLIERKAARDAGNQAISLRAVELMGKVLGLYVDKSLLEVDVKVERIERVIVDHLPGKQVIDGSVTDITPDDKG